MLTVGVAGVLFGPDGRVLLVRTARAGWELPGGRIEAGEDLVTALQRETREETGCSATVERLVAVHMNPERARMLLVFRGTAHGSPSLAPGDEDALEAAWFAPSEALQRVTHATERDCLRHGLDDLPGVAYCAFSGPEAGSPAVVRRTRF